MRYRVGCKILCRYGDPNGYELKMEIEVDNKEEAIKIYRKLEEFHNHKLLIEGPNMMIQHVFYGLFRIDKEEITARII